MIGAIFIYVNVEIGNSSIYQTKIAVYILHQSRAALSTYKFYEIFHFHIKQFDVCMHLICLTSYISFRLTFQDIIIIIIAIVAN